MNSYRDLSNPVECKGKVFFIRLRSVMTFSIIFKFSLNLSQHWKQYLSWRMRFNPLIWQLSIFFQRKKGLLCGPFYVTGHIIQSYTHVQCFIILLCFSSILKLCFYVFSIFYYKIINSFHLNKLESSSPKGCFEPGLVEIN